MYKRTIWQDHVEGIQEGTDMNAANFNNLEAGTMEANAMAAINAEYQRHANDIAKDNETFVVRCTIEEASSVVHVDIPDTHRRNTTNYRVVPVIVKYTGTADGYVGIASSDVDGLSVVYYGSASAVTVDFHISGGMI